MFITSRFVQTAKMALATISIFSLTLMGEVRSPLKLETIPLPDLREGDFDHFAIDLEGHGLFLTAEENGKVLVFDTNTNKLIHVITGLKAPHAAIYRIDSQRLFVVDGDDSAVKVYDGNTYGLTGGEDRDRRGFHGLRPCDTLHVCRQRRQGSSCPIFIYQRNRHERSQEG
jgi:hypothetical protein